MEKNIKTKSKINIDDFLVLIHWTKTFITFEGDTFLYNDLILQAESYKYLNTPFDTNIHLIDELLIDSFKLYNKIERTEDKVKEILNILSIPFIDSETMKKETDNFKRIFEDIMENYKFENKETINIQKVFLSKKLQHCIKIEDYENAAKLRDIINSK